MNPFRAKLQSRFGDKVLTIRVVWTAVLRKRTEELHALLTRVITYDTFTGDQSK